MWLGAVALVMGLAGAAGAQSSGCTLDKGIYTCSWPAFRQTLAGATTVRVVTEPVDAFANSQMAKLVRRLGKMDVTASEGPADLTFLLIPLNNAGSYFGSADQDIATLRIYVGRTAERPGTLIWAETYRGQEDVPWPSAVHYLLDQFEDRLKNR
jgi:hypothetical protein